MKKRGGENEEEEEEAKHSNKHATHTKQAKQKTSKKGKCQIVNVRFGGIEIEFSAVFLAAWIAQNR